ncbi:MAG: ABC transporter ATP-binding protein [Planctomycetota bacterium]|jgi:ABC-2 type transport system ATP-binding protein
MIEFLGVSKWYGQVSALVDMSFSVQSGVTGLVGQNGAGKSTLMKLAVGLLRPSLGQVDVEGGSPLVPEIRRCLGYCPDLDSFYEDLNGLTFVTWMLRIHGYSAAEAKRRARESLQRFGMGEVMGRKIRGYSKGMRQRIKLAQALAHEPKVVFLDEPMTGLDPVARHQMSEAIRELGESGVSVMVSSHVLHELQSVVDRVLLIHQGRLMAEGTVSDLRRQLEDRPHRLRLRSRHPRELAARLTSLEVVSGLTFTHDGLELATAGGDGLFQTLTELGADQGQLVDEIAPVDDSLEAVFGYLVS